MNRPVRSYNFLFFFKLKRRRLFRVRRFVTNEKFNQILQGPMDSYMEREVTREPLCIMIIYLF